MLIKHGWLGDIPYKDFPHLSHLWTLQTNQHANIRNLIALDSNMESAERL